MSGMINFEGLRSLNEKDIAEWKEKSAKSPAAHKPKREMYYWLPEALFKALVQVDCLPAWRLALAIYKTWYKDREHRNPVTLTSACLTEFRISKDQKSKGLRRLEKTGLFLVRNFKGRNSQVIMTWPLKY
jgi:hypothetical protein